MGLKLFSTAPIVSVDFVGAAPDPLGADPALVAAEPDPVVGAAVAFVVDFLAELLQAPAASKATTAMAAAEICRFVNLPPHLIRSRNRPCNRCWASRSKILRRFRARSKPP